MTPMTLTLGPVLFNWPTENWIAFYRRIANEAPVDRVCIGDVVCSKRWPFIADHIPEVIETLTRAGKSVILSTPILPTLRREHRIVDEFLAMPDVMVEANDVSALARLSGRPHAIGPYINVYNEGTLRHLAHHGATAICVPPELPLDSIRALSAIEDVMLEVWAFGRLPLAISARCYHARLHHLSKDSCQFVCSNDPDGRVVDDLDGRGFVAINGVQTLSYTYGNLIGDIDQLAAAGVRLLRISPHAADMVAVARLFREVIDRRLSAEEAEQKLTELMPAASYSNGFLHGRPGCEKIPA